MSKPFHTRIFKSGNSVAVRLPKGVALPEGTEVELSLDGADIRIHPVTDAAERKRRLTALLDELEALPPVGEVEKREPMYWPNRRGLY